MSPTQIVHAWKDADFAASLPPDAAASVPANPAGAIELPDSALDMAAGGAVQARTEYFETLGCCQGFTQAGKCDVTVGFPFCTMGCITIILTNPSICAAT